MILKGFVVAGAMKVFYEAFAAAAAVRDVVERLAVALRFFDDNQLAVLQSSLSVFVLLDLSVWREALVVAMRKSKLKLDLILAYVVRRDAAGLQKLNSLALFDDVEFDLRLRASNR